MKGSAWAGLGSVLLVSCGAASSPAPSAPSPESGDAASSVGSSRGLSLDTEGRPSSDGMSKALDFARKRYSRRIAVTIGIDAYLPPIPPLSSAVSDARHMAQLLQDLGFDSVTTLENTAATRAGLLDLLEMKLPAQTDDGDLVVVYFAGHGFTQNDQGFVVPQDASPPSERTSISVQRLKETALRFKAVHTLYLVDACFSGSLFHKRADGRDPNDLAYWEDAAKQRAVDVIAGGTAGEETRELGGWGLFTRALYDGLGGQADANHDGVVTVDELGTYAAGQVVASSQGRQHPQWGSVEGTAPVLMWDVRKIQPEDRPSRFTDLPLISGYENETRAIHTLMSKHDWRDALARLRDLAVRVETVEVELLLAEVYLDADPLANSQLAETELRHAEQGGPTVDQQRRLIDLRARLEKAKRSAM